jgi:serine/threonine-protein kinase RsbW
MSEAKICAAVLENLHDMLDFVKKHCLRMGFNSLATDKIILGIEEVLVNIIRHAYPNGQPGKVEIICDECPDKSGITILIKDQGIPFNPLKTIDKIKKNHLAQMDDKTIGGYGIFFYIEVMDHVEYKREEKTNSLYLVKYFND